MFGAELKLIVCPMCRRHAHIQLPASMVGSEFPGEEFASKRQGHKVVNDLRILRDLSHWQVLSLRAQIRLSDLADEHLDVDAKLLCTICEWNYNHVVSLDDPLNMSFHEFAERIAQQEIDYGFLAEIDDHFRVGIHPARPIAGSIH